MHFDNAGAMFARGRWVNAWRITIRLLFSLVPACCNIAGLDTPHKVFSNA